MNANKLTKADQEFILLTCKTLYKQLQWPNRYVFLSWGAHNFESQVFENKAALRFAVSGFLLKGYVVVAYNEGADAYEVNIFNKANQRIKKVIDVYFNELQQVIDQEVENDGNEENYKNAVDNWFSKGCPADE